MHHKELAESAGMQLSFTRTGDWREEVVLFFHGFTGSKEYFPDCDAESSTCIISFDRPGIGDSPAIESYTMEEFLEAVHSVLKAHNVTSAKLIGHSAGGYYAQLFAQMHPEMTASITLASSMVPLNTPQTKGVVGAQWKFIALLSRKFKRISKRYFKQMAKGIVEDYDKQLASNLETLPETEKRFMKEHPELIKSAILEAVANDGMGVYCDANALCQKRDSVTIPADIPVYIWHGMQDSTTPPSFVDYFESAYSAKATHLLSDAGHMLYLPNWLDILQEINP